MPDIVLTPRQLERWVRNTLEQIGKFRTANQILTTLLEAELPREPQIKQVAVLARSTADALTNDLRMVLALKGQLLKLLGSGQRQ